MDLECTALPGMSTTMKAHGSRSGFRVQGHIRDD